MKLRFEQLKLHLTEQLAAIYWLSGDEPLLHQQASDLIRKSAKQAGYQLESPVSMQHDSDWHTLINNTHTLSLFAAKSCYEIRLKSNKLTTPARKDLLSYCEKIPKNRILIIRSPKIDKATEKTKWMKTVAQAAVMIAIWPITPQQFPGWLAQQISERGMQMDAQSLALLAYCCEGNLLAAKQEIDKLFLLYGNHPISYEQISDAVSDHSQFDVFTLVDSALSGNAARCKHILERLQHSHQEPTLILWALAREIRALAKIAYGLANGEAYDALCWQNQIWPQRKALIHQALLRRKLTFFQNLLIQASHLDTVIKGINNGHIWDGLLLLTLNLSGTAIFKKR